MNKISSQVILASGELYQKSSLQPGMKLLGADSQTYELKSVAIRHIPAFEIKPAKSESFFVGFDQKIFATSKTQEPMLLKAADYKELPLSFQKNFSLAKTQIDFPKKDLPLDPYFLGLLLGDGCFRSVPIRLTTPDEEIVQSLYEFSVKYQWPVSVDYLQNNKSNSYRFKLPPKENPSLKQIISNLGLFNHKSNTKFIPKSYLYSDKTSRQALLAGLLDTDGSLQNRSYDYQSASFQLAGDIAFLARSLGLLAIERVSRRTWGPVARLYIHGDFSEIPLHVKRKISKQKSKPFQEKFTLNSAGIKEIQYLNIESYLQGNFTVRIGDQGGAL
ncbi:MAG: hypothetical protein LBT04_04740 [Prevotellaceae bacterium]|jgi:hypothetical protein|nr:hypothetical protein [Prevotellaceae bacterium]